MYNNFRHLFRHYTRFKWNCVVGFCNHILSNINGFVGFVSIKMKKLLLIILLFILISSVNAGENITTYDDSPVILNEYDNVTFAEEDGHLDTKFSNDYKGYCIEYTEQEAKIGDKFYITNTTKAINKQSNEDVSKYLKTYFVDYYDETQKDKIVTQHTIWHFTNDFDGWRLNKTLINKIKENSKNYDDDGIKKWNSTHNMKYSFRVLLSPYEHHQNYFIYQILFLPTPIENETIDQNITTENITTENITNQTITNITNNIIFKEEINLGKNNTPNHNIKSNTNININKNTLINLEKYKTGNSVAILVIIFIIIFAFFYQFEILK